MCFHIKYYLYNILYMKVKLKIVNVCKYCKNRITTLDGDRLYTDRCKKFITPDKYYESAYNARKDENKCGPSGKYFEDKYSS